MKPSGGGSTRQSRTGYACTLAHDWARRLSPLFCSLLSQKPPQASKEGGRSCVNAHPLPSRNARVGEPTSLLSCLPWHVPPHAMALPSLSTDPPEGEQHRGDQDEHHRNVKIVHHRQPSFTPDGGSRSPFPVVLFLAKGERAKSSHAAGLHRPGKSRVIASQYPHG